MMKHGLLAAALLLSFNVAHAKKNNQKKAHKMSRVDARELCHTSKGANITKKEMKKCVSKAMRTGKV